MDNVTIYDFDKVIERKGSGALKHDGLEERYGNPSLMPLWVADMDFETPDFILKAMASRLEHPILGYTMEPADYRPAIKDWIASHHDWNIDVDWISFIPGVVKGIGFALNTFLRPNEKVIIQPPVYHPFRLVPLANGHEVVYNPLREVEGGKRYEMDFDNLAKVTTDDCRMLILSNPHNPGGMAWDRDTLSRLADFCHERNIIVISDEIHSDLMMWGNRHIPFASVSDKAAQISITFGAPTKTFNIAGLAASYAIIPSENLRLRYFMRLKSLELDEPHIFAPIATIAAFREGEQWRQQMLRYVEDNISRIIDFCTGYIPQIVPWRPDASYLVWLDCRQLGLDQESLVRLFTDKAGLALNDGSMFGKEGEGFMRLNAAAPRSIIDKALSKLENAVKSIN